MAYTINQYCIDRTDQQRTVVFFKFELFADLSLALDIACAHIHIHIKRGRHISVDLSLYSKYKLKKQS